MLGLIISLLMASSSPLLTAHLLFPIVEVAPPDSKEIWIEALHNCENVNNVPRILDTNDKYSYGYLMFQMKTWLKYGKELGATRENIKDNELQKKVARSILDAGGSSHWWNCSKKIGLYPS